MRSWGGPGVCSVMLRPAVFLDRDDTLIENGRLPRESWAGGLRGDLCDPRFVVPMAGAVEACRAMAGAGYCLVVVSNQGLVARGHGTIEQVEATNAAMRRLFVDEHGRGLLAAVYYAPWHPEGTVREFAREHAWRKPGPGMTLAAAAALGLDVARSWTIGDKERDLAAGIGAGVPAERCLLVGGTMGIAEAGRMVVRG